MKMDTETARLRIARGTHEAEQAVNEALLKSSRLFATLVEARQETESPAFTGHQELIRLAKGQQGLLDVAGELARVHGGLLKLQEQVTGFDDCPEVKPMKGALVEEPKHLRA